MKKLIINLLGLNSLVNLVDLLRKENEELKKNYLDCCVRLGELETKLDDLEIPDTDDFVSENDIDSKIEDYLYNNDYATVDKVSELIDEQDTESLVEKVIEEIDLTDRVEGIVKRMDKASFGDTEELKSIVTEVLKTIRLKVE